MSENKSNSSSRVSFLSLLTLLFIGLKLTGYIDWSWWWVLSPLWGGLALVIAIILITLAIQIVSAVAAYAVRRIHYARNMRKIKK